MKMAMRILGRLSCGNDDDDNVEDNDKDDDEDDNDDEESNYEEVDNEIADDCASSTEVEWALAHS